MTVAPAGLSRRERQRRATIVEIQAVARRLLVADGDHAVTLRGIAAEMGLSAPALYRYYASRDDLLDSMVADLYGELTSTLEHDRDAALSPEASSRLVAACRAFRTWALAHPAEFRLVFANPIPSAGHWGSPDVDRAAERFGSVFVDLFVELWEGPGFPTPDAAHLKSQHLHQLATTCGPAGGRLPPDAMHVLLRCWTRLYGTVALEVFGHLRWVVEDLDPVFDDVLSELAETLAFPTPPAGDGS